MRYQTGFGGHFESEAVEGALPKGRNSPQRPPFGLYAEQLSGTAFTAPRHEFRRSWLFRLCPCAAHRPYVAYARAPHLLLVFAGEAGCPNRLRWDALAYPDAPTDFFDALTTYAGNGDATQMTG